MLLVKNTNNGGQAGETNNGEQKKNAITLCK